MAYTAIDDPTAYFQTKLWTGNGGTQSITSLDFAPDWVWIKNRSAAEHHFAFDTVRGATKRLKVNADSAEGTESDSLTAFTSNGFNVGYTTEVNGSGNNIVSWNWKAGTSVSGNTGGSGTAKSYSGSVNTDSGISIISYTGNGSAGHTIPHHLGVIPKMVIAKVTVGNTNNWGVYHHTLGTNKTLYLDLSMAAETSSFINDTTPTSSVVSLSSNISNQDGKTFIMYSFAEKQGYSKFGSYTGNGNADGTFIYTGFKPAFVLFKRTSSTSNWSLFDNKRNTFNITDSYVQADTTAAEQEYSDIYVDFLSNGIKQRGTNISLNSSGDSFVYMAFAENPFTTSSGIPACAR